MPSRQFVKLPCPGLTRSFPTFTSNLLALLSSVIPVDSLGLGGHQRDQAVLQLPPAVTLVKNKEIVAFLVETERPGDIVRGGRVPLRPGKAVTMVSKLVQVLYGGERGRTR